MPSASESSQSAIVQEEEAPPLGPKANVVAALLALLISGGVLWSALSYGVGRVDAPGPGLWPAVLGTSLAICAVALLLRAHSTEAGETFSRGAVLVVVTCIVLLVFGFLIGDVGFEVLTLLFIASWLRFVGRESLRTTVVISLVATTMFYLVFVEALEIPLPHIIRL